MLERIFFPSSSSPSLSFFPAAMATASLTVCVNGQVMGLILSFDDLLWSAVEVLLLLAVGSCWSLAVVVLSCASDDIMVSLWKF